MSYYNEAIMKHIYTHMATEGKEKYQKFFKSALGKRKQRGSAGFSA